MNGATVNTSRFFGWLLYIGGTALLIGYGAYQFAIDDEAPAFIKTGVAALVLGLLMLFFSVFQQRMATAKKDKYKDVQI